MPVVINEFEVVSEPAQSAAAPAAPANDKPKPKLDPVALEAPLARLQDQALRVFAH
jgi:hypothetical protein